MADEVLVLIVASELDDERPASAEESSEYADRILEMEATREEGSWAGGGDGARTVFVWD